MPSPNVNGLTVVIDTREQLPWTLCFPSVSRKLPAGDYSLVGLEDRIAIERKSLGDFINTVIHDWIRFRKELNRLSGYEMACIVVEGNVQDVIDRRYESEANPQSILGRTHSIFVDHGIPVFWWGPRSAAVHLAERLLHIAWKRWGGDV